jgi:hypothetical protein
LRGGPALLCERDRRLVEVVVRRCVTDPCKPQVPENDSVKHRPMLVTSGPLRPDNDKHGLEVKWDGFRALIVG